MRLKGAKYMFGLSDRPPGEKIRQLSFTLLVLITMIACIGFMGLYSVAGGSFSPWAGKQILRFGVSLALLVVIALMDIRVIMKITWPLYGGSLFLLVLVEIMGDIGMGAQRWLDIGPVSIQPSEFMKIAIILALARYYHGMTLETAQESPRLLAPLLLILAPVALIAKQPDLGTALLIVMTGAAVLFMAGVRLRWFVGSILAAIPAGFIGWSFLRPYQKNRVLTFMDPEADPLGKGYHLLQSKIALGSGGLFGKGFLQGTQSHLNFLPEKHTDFIFTMLAEEWGMAGGLFLLGLYVLLIAYCMLVALMCRSHFARLVAMGFASSFFIYLFINVGMVMGLLPVVGVPLPLVSYGGSAMLTLMAGFGLVMNAYVHRDMEIGLSGTGR